MDKEKVLIVQNVEREGAGLIAEVLSKRNYKTEVVDLNEEEFPEPHGYSAVFVLGGSDSANDQTKKMKNELQMIKEIIDASIPYFGVCLGMQALVKSAGGNVLANKIREVGCKNLDGEYYKVELTREGIRDPVFAGIKSPFKIFQLHGETVNLSDSMKLLGTGKHCKNQIVRIGKNAYGVQGHLEVTESLLKTWLAEDSMFDDHDKNKIMSDFTSLKNEYHANGLELIENFLKLAEKQNEIKLNVVYNE